MTTPDPLVVTPDEARAQAEELERGAAETDALMNRIREARDSSRSESSTYEGEYAPKDEFSGIQTPTQQTGVGLMLHLAQRKEAYSSRAAALRVAIADLEAMDVENAEDIDAIETPDLKEESQPA